jgi:hypothetical protein
LMGDCVVHCAGDQSLSSRGRPDWRLLREYDTDERWPRTIFPHNF